MNKAVTSDEMTTIPVETEASLNAEKLRQLFPEAFADGQLDLASLLQLIGKDGESSTERYGLNWHGKRAARQAAMDPSLGALRPAEGQSVDWDSTRNLFVEGDNLEALKLLQKSLYGRVKMIYIDPPYNTGSDLVYKDNYRDSIANYKWVTGQTDAAGLPVTSAVEATGRLHTSWLNMMYPRLKLARNLLRPDGVIFMSIDEREVGNARLLLAEIFGEHNAISEFIWHAKKGGGSDQGGVVTEHEYILCFARDASKNPLGHIDVAPEVLDQEDDRGPYRRGRELNKWGAGSLRRDRETMFFPIPGPDGEDVFPIRNDGQEGRWRRGHKQMMSTVQRGDVEYVSRGDGTFTVYEKIRSTDARAKPHRTLLLNQGQTADGTKAVKALFDGEKIFDFTKPPSLIKSLIEMAAPLDPGPDGDTDFIVLDFFAGSGTTAEAVMRLNAEDEGDRRFVLVQLPEPIDLVSAGQTAARALCAGLGVDGNIAEITKERVRRAGTAVKKESEGVVDVGFRVLTLDSTNLLEWDADTNDLEASLLSALDHVKADRSSMDLLFEIMLKLGIDPTSTIQSLTVAGQETFVVAAGPLIACLGATYDDADVTTFVQSLGTLAATIAEGRDVTVILKDTAFPNDVAKANLIAALDQSDITNVRTI